MRANIRGHEGFLGRQIAARLEHDPNADVVIDLQTASAEAAEARIAEHAGVRRYLLVSSIAEYGNLESRPMPLRTEGPFEPEDDHGRGKAVARARFEASDLPVTTLFLPQLYGPANPRAREAILFEAGEAARAVRPGAVSTRRDNGFVEDIAEVIARLAVHEGPLPRRLNVAGEGPIENRTLIEAADALRADGLVTTEAQGAREAPFGSRDLYVDLGPLRALLGPLPATPAAKAMAACRHTDC